MKLTVREIVVVFSFLVCFLVPSFTHFIGFVGSFQFMLLGNVIPPVMFYYVKRDSLSRTSSFFQICFISVAVGLWIICTVFSVLKFLK